MRYRIYNITLTLVLFFQFACGNANKQKSENKTNNKIARVAETKTQQSLKIKDSSVSKTDSVTDNNYPIIMVGMYNKDRAFKQVKKWGVTHVHRYGMGKSIEKDQGFFDRAQKYGLNVMSDLRARYWLKGDKDLEKFRKYISHFKEHPSLGFWYLSDEPDNKGIKPDELKPLYQVLKEEAQDIPIANAHARSKNWYKYGDVQDILMYDYYPIYGGTFSKNKLNAWTSFTKSAVKNGESDNNWVIPILQIFSWKAFAKDDQKKYRDYAVEKLRYPNTDELRYMIFSSIALGARGIALFSYGRSHMVNPKWGDKVLAPVLEEAKAFARHFHDIQKQNVSSLKDKKILLTRWKSDEAEFIVLANTTPEERKVRLNISDKLNDLEEYEPWGQTRKEINLSLSEQQLTLDKIEPWEIIILQR